MEIWPHARTLRLTGDDDRIGVVACHGFTGSVQSIAPWAEAIRSGTGAHVICPRLSGHGTRWQDMINVRWQDWNRDVEQAYAELAARCERVFVAGLSMGGALALGLAEHHDVAGVLLVNPAIDSWDPVMKMTGILKHVVATRPGIASDIAKPVVSEEGYDTLSVASVAQMIRMWKVVRRSLHQVQAPVILFRSDVDHVVDNRSHRTILDVLPQAELVRLRNSFHVATLDHDAPLIERESVAFIKRVAG